MTRTDTNALTAWIEQEEERSRLTRKALDHLDAGRVVDQREVHVWADSLGVGWPAAPADAASMQVNSRSRLGSRQ